MLMMVFFYMVDTRKCDIMFSKIRSVYSSRILDLDFCSFWISDPDSGSRGHKSTASRIRNTVSNDMLIILAVLFCFIILLIMGIILSSVVDPDPDPVGSGSGRIRNFLPDPE